MLWFSLESETNLYVCHGVVVLLQSAVVDECIFCEDGEVLADVIIQTSLILGSHHVGLAVGLIHVVTCLGIELLAHYRGDDECINTLALLPILPFRLQSFEFASPWLVMLLAKAIPVE